MQYNLRVYEDDLKKFLRLCHDHGLTRKAGFSLLLSCCNSTEADKTSYAADEIKLLHERLAAQTAALKIAQDTVDKLSMRLRQDHRYQSLLQTTQALLKSYCEVALIDDEPFARLRICRADRFPHLSSYQYPATEQGTQTIILQGLVYGNGRTPAIFVLARTVNNQLLKYRYYPRSDYVGIQIPNSGWTYLGAKWIVSWTRTRDGAIQLTGSLPLPLSLDTLVPEDYIRYQQDKMSLDQKIKNAQNRP